MARTSHGLQPRNAVREKRRLSEYDRFLSSGPTKVVSLDRVRGRVARAAEAKRMVTVFGAVVSELVGQQNEVCKKVERRNYALSVWAGCRTVSLQWHVFKVERLILDVGSCPGEHFWLRMELSPVRTARVEQLVRPVFGSVAIVLANIDANSADVLFGPSSKHRAWGPALGFSVEI